MPQILEEVKAAIGFLTRLPMRFSVDPPSLGQSAWAFPLAGLVPGAFAGGVLWAANAVALPTLAAAFLAVAAAAAITGALHEDGVADCGDAFAAPGDRARRLEIMRDSRIGAHGALALILTVGLRIAALEVLADREMWFAAAAALAAARTAPVILMRWLPLARVDGLAVYAGRPSVFRTGAALIIAGAMLLGVGPSGAVAFLAAGLSLFLWGMLARRRFGGYTGDILGASEQIAEIVLLLTLATVL